MKTFVALYRGSTVSSAELVAVSADPEIIAQVSRQLLGQQTAPGDPVVQKLDRGRRSALQVIHTEALDDSHGPGRFSVIPSDAASPPTSDRTAAERADATRRIKPSKKTDP